MRRDAERAWDRALGIQTAGREDERGGRYMPYEPTPYPVLERLAAGGLVRAGDRLLDYGCGKGRAAFFLAAQTGCHATGIDHSPRLIAAAEANRARFAHPERVAFLCAGAERYDPRDENVFFFFNPFSAAVLGAVLRRIRRSRTENPRPMRLLFYYPTDAFADCLAGAGWLRPAGEIDCRDLFDGGAPQERIIAWAPEGE